MSDGAAGAASFFRFLIFHLVRTFGRPVTASPSFHRPASWSFSTRSQRDSTLRARTSVSFCLRLLWIDMSRPSGGKGEAPDSPGPGP